MGLRDLLDGLVPQKLWWNSTPGWWYDESGLGRMQKFIIKRVVMVEKLGQRPARLLLDLLSLLEFVIPKALLGWGDRSHSAGPGERRTCSYRLQSSAKKCLLRRQKLWTAIDHALACSTSHGTPYSITIADLGGVMATSPTVAHSAPEGGVRGSSHTKGSLGNGPKDKVETRPLP